LKLEFDVKPTGINFCPFISNFKQFPLCPF